MRMSAIASLTLIASAAVAAPPPTPEKILAGRTPGTPTSCIMQSRIDDSQIFDNGSIYYKMKGGPDYLNTPNQCTQLRHDRGLVSRTPSDQLCSGDIVEIVDFSTHFNYGGCGLGEFVPYPKVKRH